MSAAESLENLQELVCGKQGMKQVEVLTGTLTVC
jgi:hypothetical protein